MSGLGTPAIVGFCSPSTGKKGLDKVLGLAYFFSEISPDSPEGSINLAQEVKDYAPIYFLYILLGLIWNIGRYTGYRHQFRAYKKGFLGFFKPIWKLIFWPFQSRWCITISVALMVIALHGAVFLSTPLLLVPVLFHILLIYRLRVRGRKTPNLKLLILRVFFIAKTSSFTFARLVKFWHHFGSYFTVADPSFYKVDWKKRFNYYFPIYILIIFFLFTTLTESGNNNNKKEETTVENTSEEPVKTENKNEEIKTLDVFFGFIILLIFGSIIYIISNNISYKRKFIHSEGLLKKRLKKLYRWPKGYENTFKEFPVMCYDNTWKQAVDVLAKTADVILMDLRGYSDKNKGCEYEVDYLFDHVPVGNIVFLGYQDSIPKIKEMIKERWEMLLHTSPNLQANSPEVLLYITGKENNKDIQGILDTLLETQGVAKALNK